MKESLDQQHFHFEPTVIPRGDGSHIIHAGKPIPGRKKLSLPQAAKQKNVPYSTLLRLYSAGLIEGERPSPRRTMIYEDSLDAHLKATRDLEFWDDERRKRFLRTI